MEPNILQCIRELILEVKLQTEEVKSICVVDVLLVFLKGLFLWIDSAGSEQRVCG